MLSHYSDSNWKPERKKARFASGERQSSPPRVLQELLSEAGIRINGEAAWDLTVHDTALYYRVLRDGSLGFGEAYMDGLWDCPRIDELICRLLSIDADEKISGWRRMLLLGEILRHRLLNLQSPARAWQVGELHYDIGNDVFSAMLDPTMSYSCAYWHNANNLKEAQEGKLDMICRKLELHHGERLLEIGCGWGGLAQYAARHHGVEVLGLTVSREQQALALKRCDGLPVRIELMDYRNLQADPFDKIVSVGMFEHVGGKNYPMFFDTARRLLRRDGLFLLHTIGNYKTAPTTDRWVDRYIFRNGKLPSASEIATVIEDRFLIEDWHNFGIDYDLTLMAWWDNFNRAWPALRSRYSERFYRMWKYYLLMCAGYFRSRQGQLWQLVLSHRSRGDVYRSVR